MPADLDRLIVWLHERRFGPDDWIWIGEDERWEAARNPPELKEFFKKSESKFYSLRLVTLDSPRLQSTPETLKKRLIAYLEKTT